MKNLTKEKIITIIPELTDETLIPITKGYSFDLKYIAQINGERVLLRIYELALSERVQEKVAKMRAFRESGVRCQEVFAFGEVPEEDFCYTIFSFLEGEDGEVALPSLTVEEQHTAGYEAGRDLWKMHELPIDASKSAHMTFLTTKFENAVERYLKLETRIPHEQMIIEYVRRNLPLIGESKLVFAHHDYHAGNLIIQHGKYGGVIDFNRCGVDTAYSEFDKLELFSSRLSIPFSKGMVQGYFSDNVPDIFWEIRSVHMAQLLIFHMNWVTDSFPEDLPLAEEAIAYVWNMYEGFQRKIPKWYEESQA